MDSELQEAVIEARASIIWGESTEQAADALRAKGFTAAQIKLIIDTCVKERAREIRYLGFKDVLLGSALLLLGSAFFLSLHFLHIQSARLIGRLFGLAALAVGYGLWRCIRGVERLMDGARTAGSLADM